MDFPVSNICYLSLGTFNGTIRHATPHTYAYPDLLRQDILKGFGIARICLGKETLAEPLDTLNLFIH